jgi:hypothetical protein
MEMAGNENAKLSNQLSTKIWDRFVHGISKIYYTLIIGINILCCNYNTALLSYIATINVSSHFVLYIF